MRHVSIRTFTLALQTALTSWFTRTRAAEALRLPAFSPPYLLGKTASDFQFGANFAVAGASALNQSFFRDLGLDLSIIPPYSLDVQLQWFEHVLQLLGPTEQGNYDYSREKKNDFKFVHPDA